MFWGTILDSKHSQYELIANKNGDHLVLHFTNAALQFSPSENDQNQNQHSVQLYANVNENHILLAQFHPNKQTHAVFDLYFNTTMKTTLKIQGKGSIHLSGYTDLATQISQQISIQQQQFQLKRSQTNGKDKVLQLETTAIQSGSQQFQALEAHRVDAKLDLKESSHNANIQKPTQEEEDLSSDIDENELNLLLE